MNKKRSILALCLCFAGANALSDTHYVDASSTTPTWPYSTRETAATQIQDAVYAADDGDDVLVYDGTYFPSSHIVIDKAILLHSHSGMYLTIIDGTNANASCLWILTDDCIVRGFTIRHGAGTSVSGKLCGGGILALTYQPRIEYCILRDNRAYFGGGVYGGQIKYCQFLANRADTGGGAYRSALSHCTFRENFATSGGGGCESEGLPVENCTFIENEAGFGGGGYAFDADTLFTNCTFRGNQANLGGALFQGKADHCLFDANSATTNGGAASGIDAVDCTFSNNVAGLSGGGLLDSTALRCRFEANRATEWNSQGGGMFDGIAQRCVFIANRADRGAAMARGSGNGILRDSLVISNQAAQQGGALYKASAYGCTIADNAASDEGGALYLGDAGNCAFLGNAAPAAPCCSPSTSVSFSCGPLLASTNDYNVIADPQFVDRPNGDFHLAASSPCIDVGLNGWVNARTDLDKRQRIRHVFVDMGCYEYRPVYPDGDGDGMPDYWEQAHCGDPYHLDPDDDGDNDGFSNLDEYVAGTDPNDSNSFFAIDAIECDAAGTRVRWTGLDDRRYSIYWAPALTDAFERIAADVWLPQSFYDDDAHLSQTPGFYRLKVEMIP